MRLKDWKLLILEKEDQQNFQKQQKKIYIMIFSLHYVTWSRWRNCLVSIRSKPGRITCRSRSFDQRSCTLLRRMLILMLLHTSVLLQKKFGFKLEIFLNHHRTNISLKFDLILFVVKFLQFKVLNYISMMWTEFKLGFGTRAKSGFDFELFKNYFYKNLVKKLFWWNYFACIYKFHLFTVFV